jgi:hypothetical protein
VMNEGARERIPPGGSQTLSDGLEAPGTQLRMEALEDAPRLAADASGGPVVVRLTVAAAEALTDAMLAPAADDWPEDWPTRTVALEAAQDALTAALEAPPGHVDHCPACCLGHRRSQLDLEEHARVLAESRAPRVEYMAAGPTLHQLDCRVARAHSPLLVEPGGYRGKTLPVYLTAAEAEVWLSKSGRKRCQICSP